MRKQLLKKQFLLVLLTMLIAIPQGVWAQITVAGVSPDNDGCFIDEESGDPIAGVTFDASTNTLTLNNAEIYGSIESGYNNLTIHLTGTNTLNGFIRTEGEEKTLKFTHSENSSLTNSSLTINNEETIISGFSNVNFGDLNLASNAPGVYYNDSDYYMAGPAGNPSDLTITTETYYPIWICDPESDYGHTQLRGASEIETGEGTVSFDGDHTITISNVNFNYEDGTMIFVGPSMTELTVSLEGTSSIEYDRTGLNLWKSTPLTFTTNASTPGSLTGYDIVSWNYSGHGQISYENGLKAFYDADYRETISTTGTYVMIDDTEISGTMQTVEPYDGVSFDASTSTLTLNGATIGGADAAVTIKVFIDDLKIEINGTNTIYGDILYNGSNYQSSNIQINKASSAESASLTVNNVSGFGSCTWDNDLYLSAHDGLGATIDVHYEHYEGEGGSMESYYGDGIVDVTFSTTPSNAIWVAGHVPNSEGVIEGTGISEGTVTYNDGVLTLNNASLSTSETIPLIVCNGDLTVELVGSDNNVYFNGDYSTYVLKNNGTTGTLTFTGEGTLSITSECYEGDYKGLCDGFGTVNFNDNLGYQIWAGTKKISPVNIPTPMMYVSEGELNFQTDGYLFGSTTYYKIVYVDGSGDEEEVPLTNSMTGTSVNWSTYNEKVTISELTGPCTVYAYTKYNTETSDSAKAKLFGPASTKQTIVYGADPVELALAPAIEEGDGIMIYGIESSYISFDEETQKATATTMGSGSFPVPLKYTDGQYTTGNTIILNSENFEMQVEVVRDLGIEFVGTNLWASYYATENLALPVGLTAYVVSSVNEENGAVTVASIDYIPANNGVLLQRAANGAASGYTAGEYTGNTTQVTNLLAGSPEATDISSIQNQPVYVLFNDKFKRATSGTIPARRAYLPLGAAVVPSGAPQFMSININEGSVTAIETLAVDDNSNDSWYTIDGLKLNGKPQRKGIYINNGKKKYINNNK